MRSNKSGLYETYQFLYEQKWPNGFRCPRCEHHQAYTIQSTARTLPLYQCKLCRHQTTLTAGTIMEGSRTSLTKWRTVIELVSTKNSVNAVQLATIIRVTYKTAWSILHKIRRSISKLDKSRRVTGLVTNSVAFYARPPFVYFPTDREYPVWVCCAQEQEVRRDSSLERNEGLYVKIKLLTKRDLSDQKLSSSGEMRIFEENLEQQALPATLNRGEFRRDPLLYPLFMQAKHWLNSTFRGISGKYQQAYWDEFCFRLNFEHFAVPLSTLLTSLCMGCPTIAVTSEATQTVRVISA